MKLELPDDHPLALAIASAAKLGADTRLILTLSAHTDDAVHTLFLAEIPRWERTRTWNQYLKCTLIDPEVRNAQIRSMLAWPDINLPATENHEP